MTLQARWPRLTADEFIEWAMDQPQGRYELADGEVIAMSPERIEHARVKLLIAMALHAGCARLRSTCETMVDGVAVRIDDRTVYEPDALVRCGPRSPGNATSITDPVIVVEVVSPSSRNIDTGVKLTGYFRVPSVKHYLIVNIDARAITHHQRTDDGGLMTSIVRHGALNLDPPGLSIVVEAVFEDM